MRDKFLDMFGGMAVLEEIDRYKYKQSPEIDYDQTEAVSLEVRKIRKGWEK